VCPIARFLSYLRRARVIYHEHDSPTAVISGDLERAEESANGSRFQRWVLRSRKAVARRARLCIIPNQARLRHFSAETGVNGTAKCVWNCPSRSEVPAVRQRARRTGLTVWYHGSIVPSQLPETVVQALAQFPAEVELKFAGYETIGHQGYIQHLLGVARNLGIADRVQYLGLLPDRATLLDLCSQCHVGVALFPRTNRQPMAGASNKPFDYLACSLALLVSDLPDWRDTYVVPGYALVCDPADPDSIAAALRWFLEHRDETRTMGDRGRQRIIESWNYESQFQPVSTLINC
jgi:glycosyltransferase involved in cell wall biosynthesis